MPPLAVAIPVVNRRNTPYDGRGKWPAGRKYGDGPLPTKISDHTPRNARITARVADANGVAYTLRIGEVELTDIGADEILDYVSPLYLEQYENDQFAEERQVLAALEVERQAQKRERLERQKDRGKTKGTVSFEEVDSADDATGVESGDHGARGRARPTYTHLFKKPKERRRRERNPQTGLLMPLSDEDEDDENQLLPTEEDTPPQPRAFARPAGPFAELPSKRRRRKRDKVTGELLPLSPIAQLPEATSKKKRPRRRRHPLTGELMPIGWKYDSENEEEDDASINASQSLRNLSLVQGHEAKRPRLTSDNQRSSSPSPAQRGLTNAPLSAHKFDQCAMVDPSIPIRGRPNILPPKLKSTHGENNSAAAIDLTDEPSLEELSPSSESELRTSITRPTARWKASISPALLIKQRPKSSVHSVKEVTTSLRNPSAAHVSSSSAPISDVDVDAEEDEDEDEWEVEKIIAHRYSNPATHPPGLQDAPVMLYRTKWVGSDELTWEPLISFGDWDFIRDYRRRAGLPSEPSDAETVDDDEDQTTTLPRSSNAALQALPSPIRDPILATGETDDSGSESDADEEMDEEQFEFETILSHHLSDPRTHPPQLGKTPVMLYRVKWKGWEEPTWEPAGSFEDPRMLEEYRKRVGLKPHSVPR